MYFKVKLGNSNNAALFVSVCSSFEPYIDYKIGRYTVDAKSIMGVLSTSLDKVATVIINTDDEHIIKSFKKDINLWIVEGVSLKILLEDINDVTCFVNGGNFYEGEIEVAQKRYRINGRSFIGMCSIDLTEPIDVRIITENPVSKEDFYKFIKKWEVRE